MSKRIKIIKKILILNVILLLGCLLGNVYAIPTEERNALIDLYNSTDGANWRDNTNWPGAEGTECTWYGVVCDAENKNVTKIELYDNELAGTVPNSIGSFPHLSVLSMGKNQLTGNIPAEVGNLSNLLFLYLWGNQLTGDIPAQLGNLSNLTDLQLAQNQLTGNIPFEFGGLSNLRILYLWENQLTGTIPSSLVNLSNLTSLSLGGNQLTGNIPEWLGTFTNLELLVLRDNQLTGNIPAELGNLTNLQQLWLHGNQLTGSIPSELGNLSNLTKFILYSNQLTGTIPPELGNLSNLQDLRLSYNQLTGSIPAELGNFSQLEILYLGDNQLTGSIPDALGNLISLKELEIWGCQLDGTIPASLGSLSNLMILNLSDNQLSGSIPSSLGNLTNLTKLWLNNNQLSGSIPAELKNLTNLTDNQSDFRNNQLYTPDSDLRAFLNTKQINGDWESTQISDPDLNRGLVAYYPFNGNANDESGNGNHGIVHGVTPDAGINGIPNTAYRFSDDQDTNQPSPSYIQIPDSPSLRPASAFTISAWIKADSLNPNRGYHIIAKEYESGSKDSYVLFYHTVLNFGVSDQNDHPGIGAAISNLNEWRHITGLWDGISLQIYIDGSKAGNILFSGPVVYDDNPVFIGADDNDGDGVPEAGWNGVIDEVRIYSRILSETEIQMVYQQSGDVLTADFSAAPVSGIAPLTVQFTDQSFGNPTSWQWDFNNDGTVDSTEQNPSFIYNAEAVYSVRLAVSDGDSTDEELKTDCIGVSAPVVSDFSADKTSGSAPFTVNFTDKSFGDPTSWQWDFNNDGIIDSEEQHPSFTYDTEGLYSVRLFISDGNSTDEELKTDYIGVSAPVISDFAADKTSGTAPLTVKFTDKSFGDPTLWQWDFNNDGVTDSTKQNPEYTYQTEGTYSVRLAVSNGTDTDDELKSDYIQANILTAAFAADKTHGNPALAVQFTDQSEGDITSWQWDFDNDGTIDSTEQNPSFTYNTTGIYSVKLIVANADSTDEEIKTDFIRVASAPNLQAAQVRCLQAIVGQPFDVSWSIQNTGGGDAEGEWTDRVYFSSDDVWDEGDTLLGEFAQTGGLAADSEYWRTESVQAPDVSPETYYVIVKTDADGTVNETDENDNTAAKSVSFTNLKVMTAAPDRIPLNLTPGVPVTGEIEIGNIGDTDISGIAVTVQDASSNITIQTDAPSVLASLSSGSVSYTVTASNDSVLENEATLLFMTSNGLGATVTFELSVIPEKPRLVVEPGYLESGMLRGEQRMVACEVANTGGVAANDLQVLVPEASWLKLVTPESVGTLAQGEKTKIELLLNPAEDMPLGPYSGRFSVSGSNASLSVGFQFTAVSEAKGGLKIIAKDEFSYFATDHPNVAGATVSLKDAYGDTVVAEGVTDESGIFVAQGVNEGRYNLEVRAEKHGTHHSTIEIVPGVEKEVEAFMPRQLVTYNWSVVPILIEDKYKVTLEAVFETHVPAPVVTVEPYFDIVPFYEDETGNFDLTVTNHGLIAVNNTTLILPKSENYIFESPIQNIGTLPAMTSIIIPVSVRSKPQRRGLPSQEELCEGIAGEIISYHPCKKNNKHHSPYRRKAYKISKKAKSLYGCVKKMKPSSCLSLICSELLGDCLCALYNLVKNPPNPVSAGKYLAKCIICNWGPGDFECSGCEGGGIIYPTGGGGGGGDLIICGEKIGK